MAFDTAWRTETTGVDPSKLVDLYLRKSKIVEEGTDALSIEAQEQRGREWAAREGLTVRKVWKDNLSGYRDIKRPDFDKALKGVARGEVKTLWCAALDRFSRRGARHIIPLLTEGVRFYFDWERLDSADPRDFRMILWRAEDAKEYGDRMSANIKGTKAQMREAGAWHQRAPYGTRVVGKKITRRLVPDDETWPVVVDIYTWSADGVSSREICARLNASGIPAPSGGAWSMGSVTHIANNPVYEGWMTVRVGNRLLVFLNRDGGRVRTFAEGAETIPEDLARDARAMRRARHESDRRQVRGPKVRKPGGPGHASHLLTGFTHCAGCDARMPASGRSHVCGTRKEGKPCPSPANVLRAYLEPYVVDMWVGHVTALDPADEADAVRIAAILDRWNALNKPEETEEAAEVRRRADELVTRLTRLRGDRDAGLFDGPGGTEDYSRRYREALAAWETANERLAEITHDQVTIAEWDPEELLTAWNHADLALQRGLLRLAIDRITVTKAPRRGYPWNGDARVTITWTGDYES